MLVALRIAHGEGESRSWGKGNHRTNQVPAAKIEASGLIMCRTLLVWYVLGS